MKPQTLLKELGLTAKETNLYLALLTAGRSTPTSLSKTTGINRATVYSVAKGLISKGLITEDTSGKTLYFVALPLSSLEQLIEKPRRELEEKEELVTQTINQLSLISAKEAYPVPNIRFIQEDSLNNFLYENIRKWQRATLAYDGVVWGFQDESFAETYRDWIAYGWRTKESKDPRYIVRHLTNMSSFEKGMKKFSNRFIQFLTDVDFTSTVWVAGDYLAMVVTKQHPYYLVEIQDKTLAHNMREVLQTLWNKNK